MLGSFRLIDSSDHTGSLADTSPKRCFQIHHFTIACRLVGASLKTRDLGGSGLELLVRRYPSLAGALIARHLHAFDHRIGDLGGKKTNRT